MSKEDYERIHARAEHIRERREFGIKVLWNDERALWLAEVHWRLGVGPIERSLDIIAVEAPTVREALAKLGEEIEAP
jgi:hypothetical protein